MFTCYNCAKKSSVGLNKEDFFIDRISAHTKAIGDDGALKDGLIYSKDAFFENVHFKRKWLSCYQIAQKAMMVNISDAVAMNAVPKYALLALGIPKTLSRSDMRQLSRGFIETAARYGIEIIGGDTIANSKIDITVTIISHTTHPLWRSGIKRGDWIAYTGQLGYAKRDLRYLMAGGSLHAKSHFHRVHVRDAFVSKSRRYLRVGMDISDGLFADLKKLSQRNRCGFRLNKPLLNSLGCSGEEYEMLVACSPHHKRALMRYAQKTRTPLHFIGRAVRGTFVNSCKNHHF